MGHNWVFNRVLLGHAEFFLFFIFFNPVRLQPRVGQVPG